MYLFANYICYQFMVNPYLPANNWVKQEAVGRLPVCIVIKQALIHCGHDGAASRGGTGNEKIPYCSNIDNVR
jgi:hypothetical protein